MTAPIILRSIEIERELFGDAKGTYKGKVRFDGEHADVTLKLSHEQCQQIIDMCAGNIIDCAHDIAGLMRSDVIESVSTEKLIEGY